MFQIILACYEKNIGYVAAAEHEINAGDANSLDARQSSKECQDLCHKHPECQFWTHQTNLQICHLKKVKGAKTSREDMTSGLKVCGK